MIVAKEFKTYNRRFHIGDSVYETDDLGDKSFAALVSDGYLADAPTVTPAQRAPRRVPTTPLAVLEPVPTDTFVPEPDPENDRVAALQAAWESNDKIDDKVVYRVNEPNGIDVYGTVSVDSDDMVGIDIPGEPLTRYYFSRNVDRDKRVASGTYGHLASGADQPPDKA